MKILKTIGITILSIIVLLLIIAIFVPKSYTVSVSETINKPRQEVFDYVRILDNQKKYSIWVMEDPNLNPEIVGTDGTVGAIQKWNSANDNVGEGEQEITSLSIDKMSVDLRFKRPFEGTAKAANIFKEVSPNQTEIIAEFYSNDSYPMNIMSYFIGRNMIKKAEIQNLKNLKAILEKTN